MFQKEKKPKQDKCFPGPEAAEPLWNIFPTLIDLYPWFLKYCNQLDNHCEQKTFPKVHSYLREGREVATNESKPGF